MRVFLFAPHWYRYEQSIAHALRQQGHEVNLLSYVRISSIREWLGLKTLYRHKQARSALYFLGDQDQRGNERFVGCVKDDKPELLFIIKGEVIKPQYLSELKHILQGTLFVNWIMDSPFRYRNVFTSVHLYDLFFSFEPTDVERLQKLNVRAFFLPLAFDPRFYRKVPLSAWDRQRYGCDICFVGERYPERERVFQQLSEFDVKIWGPSWVPKPWSLDFYRLPFRGLPQRMVDEVWGTEVAKIYNAAKICLNIHHLQSKQGLNMRTFEILGAGGFQIVDYKKALESLFDIGEELVCYRSLEELRDLLHYYLDHPTERERIAEQGHRRAWHEHTFEARMQSMLSCIE
jgi:spore maturation protein CgeB